MNVIRLIGGLGNQITQYALGQVLQKSGKQVAYDLSWYSGKAARQRGALRPYCLDKFQIPDFHICPLIGANPTIHEDKVGFNPTILQMKNDNNYSGYWQYYSYYTDILPLLRQQLQIRSEFYTPRFLELADLIIDSDSVSLHVRRGDYRFGRKADFKDLPARYYLNAIGETKGDLFIFSDDLPWCREIFKPEYFKRKVYFIGEANFYCFELIKFCKRHIITNSTFSFWPALLNDNPDKIVWCPKHYLGDTAKYSNQFRYPQEWIKLEDYIEPISEKCLT